MQFVDVLMIVYNADCQTQCLSIYSVQFVCVAYNMLGVACSCAIAPSLLAK
jgi:hypothetical protein